MISDKRLKQIHKELGKESVTDMESSDKAKLKETIVQAETAIKDAISELESNPKYQELKDSLKALSEGMRAVKKRQRAKIDYALHLLEGDDK